MGIPVGSMARQGSPPISNLQESQYQPEQQNEFASFEETFKSMNLPAENSNIETIQPQNKIPFDDQPVGGAGNSNQLINASPQPIQQKENLNPDPTLLNLNDQQPQINERQSNIQENQTDQHPTSDLVQKDPNVVNVDEIQIMPKEKLTFEELLEKQLNQKENQEEVLPEDDRVIRKPKKEFLKRTSKKTKVPKK